MKYKTLFFDLDGTIMKTDEGVVKAHRYAVKEAGKELGLDESTFPFERTDWFMGPSIDHFLGNHVPGMQSQEKRDEYLRVFRVYYQATGVHECHPYAGIIDLLKECGEKGYKVYVCTSKNQPAALTIAEEFGFAPLLHGLCGATGELKDKVDILRQYLKDLGTDPAECAMIGDRYTDLDGGRQNGTATVGVLYGYGDLEELESCKPDFIAKTVEELREYLING